MKTFRLRFLGVCAALAIFSLAWVAQNTGYNSTQFDTTTVGVISMLNGVAMTNLTLGDSANTATLHLKAFGGGGLDIAFASTPAGLTINHAVLVTGAVTASGGFSATGGTLTLNNANYTASTLLSLDGSKIAVSIANAAGSLTNDGSGALGFNQNLNLVNLNIGTMVVTNPPVLNLQSSTNLLGQTVVYNTNANDTATMPVGKYTFLSTNNNVALASAFLAGSAWGATNVNWSVLFITNTTGTAITFKPPVNCTCPGTAPGSANTFYVTNWAVFSAVGYANLFTGGVFRSFP